VKFEELKSTSRSGDSMHAGHGRLEQFLEGHGRDLMRLLMHAQFDARAAAEPTSPVFSADGMKRTQVPEATTRQLSTVVGEVKVTRSRHEAHGKPGLHPLDGELELPSGLYTQEVSRRLARHAAEVHFDKALSLVRETTGVAVPKRQAEELVRATVQDFEAFRASRQAIKEPDEDKHFFAIDIGQTGGVGRSGDLREATRKRAEAGGKLETRFVRGEPHAGKRMATVAAVYQIAPDVQAASDVIGGLRRAADTPAAPGPTPRNKRVWASLERPLSEVIAELFDEATGQEPNNQRRWLAFVDGDPKLEVAIRREATKREVEVVIVVDAIQPFNTSGRQDTASASRPHWQSRSGCSNVSSVSSKETRARSPPACIAAPPSGVSPRPIASLSTKRPASS
jgi:hypothetical protein